MSTTRKLLPRAERQEAIEQAAARAFVRSGYAATSMDDVAAEAGVTKVLIYRHVESKEALYRAVLERTTDELRRQFELTPATLPDAAIGAHLATARLDPDGYRLLFVHAEREPTFAGHVAVVVELLVAMADELFGELVPAHLRAWSTRTSIAILVDAVLSWMEVGNPDHDADFCRRTAAGLTAFVGQLIADPGPASAS